MRIKKSLMVALAGLSILVACNEKKVDVATQTTTTSAVAPMSAQQILEVVRYAYVGQIAEAHLAQDRSTDPKVKTLAWSMMEEHTDLDQKAFEIGKKLNFQLSESLTSASLKDDADRTVAELRGKSGPDLDRAYVSAQVSEQQHLLDVIDGRLLPAATDADVRSYLTDVRKVVVSHLDDSMRLQRDMAAR